MQSPLIRPAKLEFNESINPDLKKALMKMLLFWEKENNIETIGRVPTIFKYPYDLVRFIIYAYLHTGDEFLTRSLKCSIYLKDLSSMKLPWNLYIDKARGVCELLSYQHLGRGENRNYCLVVPFNCFSPALVWQKELVLSGPKVASILKEWPDNKQIMTDADELKDHVVRIMKFRSYNLAPRFITAS